ncbi:MAG: hypothetical protein ABI547_06715 [Betaproteobacteria bacterium]
MTVSVDPLVVQFNLVHDCIRACIYIDYIKRKNHKAIAWQSITDMCSAEAVISWNQIFGANSQDAHWKKLVPKLVEKLPVQDESRIKPFSKQMITDYLKISPKEWENYRRAMVNARNKRLVHFSSDLRPAMPSLTWAQNSCYLYREWLLDLLAAYQARGLVVRITKTTSPMMIESFKKQIAEVCV